MRLVFIASLAHSGSTLFDLALSCHPKVIGLGEVFHVIGEKTRGQHLEKYRRTKCSCRTTLDACPLWGPFFEHFAANPNEGVSSLYRRLLDIARDRFGDVVLSDSSKYNTHLRTLFDMAPTLGMSAEDIGVIHLVRDARGHGRSMKNRDKGGAMGDWRRLRDWRRHNANVARVIETVAARHTRIGYEELCFYTETALRRMCDFMELDFPDTMTDLSTSDGHVGVGNPMRWDEMKSKRIFYDHRWFMDASLNIAYWSQPAVRRANEAWVYGALAADTRPAAGPHLYRPT